MTESKYKKLDFTGCCPGGDFQFPMGSGKQMSEMMEKCCQEGSSFDCSAMMEMFKGEDGSFDCSKVMDFMREMMPKDK